MGECGGTRSWNANVDKLCIGKTVHVKADFFNGGNKGQYSDCHPFQQNTILSGKVLSIYLNSARIQFHLDNTIASVPKWALMTTISDEQRQFLFVVSNFVEKGNEEVLPMIPAPSRKLQLWSYRHRVLAM